MTVKPLSTRLLRRRSIYIYTCKHSLSAIWGDARFKRKYNTDLAGVIVTLEGVRTEHPRVPAVEHAPRALGAETSIPAVYPRHVLESEVAGREVKMRRVQGHQKRQQLVLSLE